MPVERRFEQHQVMVKPVGHRVVVVLRAKQ